MADFTINPINVKPAEGTSLGDMINMARGVQAYQQAEQVNPLAVRQQQAQTQTAEIGTNNAQLENMLKHQQNSSRNLLKLLNDKEVTPIKIEEHVVSTMKNAGASPQAIAQAVQNLPKEGTDKELRAFVAKHATNSLTAEAQLEKLYPQAQMVNTGNALVPVQMGNEMLTGVKPGTQVGYGMASQLPPTTELVAQFGDDSGLPPGTKYLLGPAGEKTVVKPKLATALSPSAVAATGVTSEDWKNTADAATKAQQRIGIYQNIKKFAPDAFTGVGGQRKELAAGILNAAGISAYEAEKVSTEELAKNSALLAMAGGNTDAARALAEIATPNKKLNEKAIKGIADQLIGVEKMNQAKAAFLSPVAQDSAKYQEKLNVFNQVADPRLFQEATPEDVARMKARMSKAEIADFGRRVQLLKEMGLAQ
jgi:uncharacterized protein (DUF4415 family)